MNVRVSIDVEETVESMSPADLRDFANAIKSQIAKLKAMAAANPVLDGESAASYCRRMRKSGGSLMFWKNVYDVRYEIKD